MRFRSLFFTLHLIITPYLWAAEIGQKLSQQLSWDYEPEAQKVEALVNNPGLKIFWWNIGCGNLNSQIKKAEGQDALYSNLKTLAQSDQSPDILILGEHCPTPMPSATKKALNNKYPHTYHLKKNNPYSDVNNGIIVFSQQPMALVRKASLEVGETNAQLQDTTRSYLLLRVTTPMQDIYLSPLHFYNPWKKMSVPELLVNALGQDNANYQLAGKHLSFLQEDVDFATDPLVVIGDFNSAKNFFWFNSMASYSLYASVMSDGGLSEYTYPSWAAAQLGNQYPQVQIDHAFTSQALSAKTIMLQLKGSDHYPILMTISH